MDQHNESASYYEIRIHESGPTLLERPGRAYQYNQFASMACELRHLVEGELCCL